MDRHENRHADSAERFGDKSLFACPHGRSGAGHYSALRRHQHEIADEKLVGLVLPSLLYKIDIDSVRAISIDEIVMLTASDVRQEVCPHLDCVKVLNFVEFSSRAMEKYSVEFSAFGRRAPVPPIGRHIFTH